MLYEFETGKTTEVVFANAEFAMGPWIPPGVLCPAIAKNMVADFMFIPRLKAAYEKNQLKGKLKELIPTLDEEDNPIVRIIKFK